MKYRSMVFLFSFLVLGAGCRESAVDQGPAAEVTETSATTASTATTDTAATQPAAGTVKANVVKEKSKIEFIGAKVTRDHTGKFNAFDGSLEYAGAQPSRIAFDIDLNSIETDTANLTTHLKSPDFFDVGKYPKATFTSTSIAPAPAGSPAGTTHVVKGNLDMHGMTREVTIPVKAEQSAEGVRTTSEFTINRHDWGISYKGMADDLIKDNVLIKLDLMFPPPPAA